MPVTPLEAAANVDDPEVQDIIRRLSSFGLGVCVPHAHTDLDGMSALPPATVQYEEDQRVTFVAADDPVLAGTTPVAWAWQNGVRVIGRCHKNHGGTTPPPR